MKIKQQVSELQEIEQLIKQMFNELEIYRSIIERYRLKHGGSIKGGIVELSDDIDFGVVRHGKEDNATLEVYNFEKFRIKAKFKSIKEQYQKLI